MLTRTGTPPPRLRCSNLGTGVVESPAERRAQLVDNPRARPGPINEASEGRGNVCSGARPRARSQRQRASFRGLLSPCSPGRGGLHCGRKRKSGKQEQIKWRFFVASKKMNKRKCLTCNMFACRSLRDIGGRTTAAEPSGNDPPADGARDAARVQDLGARSARDNVTTQRRAERGAWTHSCARRAPRRTSTCAIP